MTIVWDEETAEWILYDDASDLILSTHATLAEAEAAQIEESIRREEAS